MRAFESRQDMLQLIQLVPDDHLEIIDLRINGNKDKADEEMLAAFNKINHGGAFMLISNEELNEQHLT